MSRCTPTKATVIVESSCCHIPPCGAACELSTTPPVFTCRPAIISQPDYRVTHPTTIGVNIKKKSIENSSCVNSAAIRQSRPDLVVRRCGTLPTLPPGTPCSTPVYMQRKVPTLLRYARTRVYCVATRTRASRFCPTTVCGCVQSVSVSKWIFS